VLLTLLYVKVNDSTATVVADDAVAAVTEVGIDDIIAVAVADAAVVEFDVLVDVDDESVADVLISGYCSYLDLVHSLCHREVHDCHLQFRY